MENDFHKAAISYLKQGLNIIPLIFIPESNGKGRKQPLVPWTPYQNQRTSEEELTIWWTKNPKAMLGCVCGKISNICTIDIDSPEGYEAIQEYIPDSLEIPTYKTQSGGLSDVFQST